MTWLTIQGGVKKVATVKHGQSCSICQRSMQEPLCVRGGGGGEKKKEQIKSNHTQEGIGHQRDSGEVHEGNGV
jgi:hypothetical protein